MVELGPWAAPFAGAYGLGVLARRWAYDHGLYAQETPAIPCISVGGLEVGGTGKTPIARWLLSALQQRGLRPGLLGAVRGD